MDSNENYVQSQLAAEITLMLLATGAVGFRLESRRVKGRRLGADDYLIIFALVTSIVMCAVGIWGASNHILAVPLQTMTPEEMVVHGQIFYSDVILCHIVYGVVKLSVALFYKTIFVNPGFTRAIHIYIVVVVAWMLAAVFGQMFSLIPVQAWWMPIEPRYRINYGAFIISIASLDVVLDMVVLCMPLFPIKQLHMTTKRRLQLAGIFVLGFFVIAASGVRLFYVVQLLNVEIGKQTTALSILTWNYIWGTLEACASIVTACLPTFGPLLRGGRSPLSIAQSARAKFSSRGGSSRHSWGLGEKAAATSVTSNEGRPQSWTELYGSTAYTVDGRTLRDTEAQNGHMGGIIVERSFGSEPHAPV